MMLMTMNGGDADADSSWCMFYLLLSDICLYHIPWILAFGPLAATGWQPRAAERVLGFDFAARHWRPGISWRGAGKQKEKESHPSGVQTCVYCIHFICICKSTCIYYDISAHAGTCTNM